MSSQIQSPLRSTLPEEADFGFGTLAIKKGLMTLSAIYCLINQECVSSTGVELEMFEIGQKRC